MLRSLLLIALLGGTAGCDVTPVEERCDAVDAFEQFVLCIGSANPSRLDIVSDLTKEIDGVNVRTIEAQGKTASGAPVGVRLFVSATSLAPADYVISVGSAFVDGGAAIDVILPNSGPEIIEYRGISGSVTLDRVTDGAQGSFQITAEDRSEERVTLQGVFRTAP